LVFIIKEQKHPRFTRKGNNLHTTVSVSMKGDTVSSATTLLKRPSQRAIRAIMHKIVKASLPWYLTCSMAQGPQPALHHLHLDRRRQLWWHPLSIVFVGMAPTPRDLC
jgi:hypothetical protein